MLPAVRHTKYWEHELNCYQFYNCKFIKELVNCHKETQTWTHHLLNKTNQQYFVVDLLNPDVRWQGGVKAESDCVFCSQVHLERETISRFSYRR